jgi:hypothetical protein
MFAIPEGAFINMKNASFAITADVDVTKAPANGVLVDQGGRFGGWTFYVKDGKPAYEYNFLGMKRFTIAADKPLPRGKSIVKFAFAYDGGGAGKGGTGTLIVNGEKVAEGRIAVTQCCGFSATEGADVGLNTGTPVSDAYEAPFPFDGKIAKVTIDLIDDKESATAEKAIETDTSDGVLKRKLSD